MEGERLASWERDDKFYLLVVVVVVVRLILKGRGGAIWRSEV